MNKIKIIYKNVIYAVKSLLYKKDDSIIVCGSWFGSKFADNPRFLYQYLSDNKDQLKLTHVVWVSYNKELCVELQEMGYEAYLMDSVESVYFHKHAKYQICNNSPVTHGKYKGELLEGYSYRSKRINLWHGTGVIKTFNMASNEYKAKVAKHPLLYGMKNYLYSNSSLFRNFIAGIGGWENCFFLTTSELELQKFKKCYPIPNKNFIVSGYPRDSYSVRLLDNERKIIGKLNSYEKVILYLPTFRNTGSDFDINMLSQSIYSVLQKNNILLIQKAHSAYEGNKCKDSKNNVLTLNPDFDINVLTPYVDLFITDYSSILADAMYFNKPLVLFTPDYGEYMKGDRGLSEDAELILESATRFSNIDDVKKFIDDNYTNFDIAKNGNYDEIRERIWGKEDKSIKKIWEDIVEQTR